MAQSLLIPATTVIRPNMMLPARNGQARITTELDSGYMACTNSFLNSLRPAMAAVPSTGTLSGMQRFADLCRSAVERIGPSPMRTSTCPSMSERPGEDADLTHILVTRQRPEYGKRDQERKDY